MNSLVSKRIMKRLLRSRIGSSRYWDVRNKLHILAVKSDLRQAFMDYTEGSTDLLRAAALLDLRHKVTVAPPLRIRRQPNVRESFFKTAMDFLQPAKAFWLYSNIEVESLICRCIGGVLNVGYILGYPKCCVEWHEDIRASE
jgi:hypothetical protein